MQNEAMELVGTMLHTNVGLSPVKHADSDKQDHIVALRVNDTPKSNELYLTVRKTSSYQFGSESTFDVKFPMKKKAIFTKFPFEVFEAVVDIEMSTTVHERIVTEKGEDGNEKQVKKVYEVKPDMVLSTKDERGLVYIRDATLPGQKSAGTLDGTYNFSIVNESPRVTLQPDKKGVVAKYQVAFYMERPPMFKAFAVGLPLILVAVLATFNVAAEQADLEIAVGIALTVVFLLPQLQFTGLPGPSKAKFTSNEIYIIVYLIGIVLTSIPKEFTLTFGSGHYQDTDDINV